MIETKKSRRILAAVFLLLAAVLSFCSILVTYFSRGLSGQINFFQIYWSALLAFVLSITIAIFIFTRCYVGAGIAECVFAAIALYSLVRNIIALGGGYLPAAYTIMSVLCSLLSIGGDVMLIIAFFKHDRASKPLFILGGILFCVSAVVGAAQSALLPVMEGYEAPAATVIGVLIGGLLAGALNLLPWLFLGLYFGAQQVKQADWPQDPLTFTYAEFPQESDGVYR